MLFWLTVVGGAAAIAEWILPQLHWRKNQRLAETLEIKVSRTAGELVGDTKTAFRAENLSC